MLGGDGPHEVKEGGMSKDDLSFIHDRYAMHSGLNQVGGQSSTTPLLKPSGADFPHIILLNFAQDKTLGRGDVWRSNPTSTPIQRSWSNLSTPFIMSASLLLTQMVQISYANNPGPTVMVEKGESFPFITKCNWGVMTTSSIIRTGNYGADLNRLPKLTPQTALILFTGGL